jgi:outer membrane protein assembly complex protein YaeT
MTEPADDCLDRRHPRRHRLGAARLAWLVPVVAAAMLTSSCKEDEPLKVASFRLEGVESVPAAELRAALATKQGSWIPFTRKPGFKRPEFARDIKRIEAFYADRGYPDARVRGVDIDLDERQGEVRIKVRVREGEPVRIASVRLEGFDVVPERARNRLRRLMALEPGAVRQRAVVAAARETALAELKEHGYPYASVAIDEIQGEQPREVQLVFRGEPGRRATFGEVAVQGNSSVSTDVITRQLAFEPGEPFRQSRVQESQRRLGRLPLFDFAYVEPRPQANQPPDVPMRVTVVEGKHRRFTAAAGYGTEDKARVRALWEHVNFFGGARTVGLEGRYSSLDRGARLAFSQPDFPFPHLSFALEGRAWNEAEPIYHRNTYGGRAALRWERDRRLPGGRRGGSTSLAVTFINELEDFRVTDEALADPSYRSELIALGLDPETGAGRGTLVALRLEGERRTSLNPLDPSRGYVLAGAVERAGGFLPGSYTYTEFSGEGRYYLPLGRRIVAAQRLRVATIDAPEPTDASVPFFKRYFLGGSTSLRGWSRYSVSPLTTSGMPLGGLTLLEASGEIRMRMTGKFRAVAFVDLGNVWPEPWRFGPDRIRVDVGPGLRYDTPIGPARLDVGYQLTPIDGLVVNGKAETRHWRIHLSIGQAF